MIDLNIFGVDLIIRQRLDEEVQMAATRSLLRRLARQQPKTRRVAAAWLGDRLIQLGLWMKQSQEPESPSNLSPWRVAGKGV